MTKRKPDAEEPAADVVIDETATLDDPAEAEDEPTIPAETSEPSARVKGESDTVEKPPRLVPVEEAAPEPGEGESVVVYRGLASVVRFEEYRFRPGQPVIVRSDVVEELLTMPNESFVEVVKE